MQGSGGPVTAGTLQSQTMGRRPMRPTRSPSTPPGDVVNPFLTPKPTVQAAPDSNGYDEQDAEERRRRYLDRSGIGMDGPFMP